MYKKIIALLLIFCLSFSLMNNTKAKTLGDLKRELQKQKEDYEKTKQEKKNKENKRIVVNDGIKKAENDIKTAEAEIEQLNKDIKALEDEIELKTKEIKKIINFYEIQNGESAYIEYIAGATDFTDMIYRSSVVEQMSRYNNNLIKEYNNKINENKQKQKELEQKEQELRDKQKALESEYNKLGAQIKDLDEIKVDEEEAIRVQEEIIKMYQDKNCKDNEDIKTCGRKVLPSDTKFWRPLTSGYISSNYGNRCFSRGCDFHTGIDIGKPSGTPVYATANGTVAALTHKYYCGGNMIFIHHHVNGKYYTSLYMHLRTINVNKGDTVTKNTIIGYSGGDSTTPWDSCTTGAHLHFTMLNGLVGTDYKAWSSSFYSHLINPRTKVNFPKLGSRFDDRLSAY